MTAAYEHNGQPVSAAQFYAIACDPRRSVAVEACAGAGKTWMLVSRIIRALLEDDVPNNELKAHEILAITFTKKAAGEMRQRLQEWLAEFAFATPEKLEKELIMRGLSPQAANNKHKVLQNLYQMLLNDGQGVQIKTFHGWFASLLRTAPLSVLDDLNLPANYTLLEDDKLAVPSVWRRFFGTLLKNEAAKNDFEELVVDHGRAQALKALTEALSKRVEFELADQQGVVDTSVPHFSKYVDEFAGETSPYDLLATEAVKAKWYARARVLGAEKNKTPVKAAEVIISAFEKPSLEERFADIRQVFFVRDEDRLTNNLTKFPAAQEAETELKLLCSAIAQHTAWLHQQRMARLTRLLITEFAALKRQRGWIDMNDVERAALKMLSSEEISGWVQLQLDMRIKHLMIDEFQDTSPLQWQALYAWLSGYAGAGGKPPTVFIVGDPKQSIYRFRRAEPRVFMAAQAFVKEGLTGDLLSCDHTRRNAVQVVQAVNTVMLQAQTLGQYANYRAHSTEIIDIGSVISLPQIERIAKANDKDSAQDKTGHPLAEQVWRDSLTMPRLEEEEKIVSLECRQAANFISTLIKSGIPPQEVMVLARKRTRLTVMQEELQALGIVSQQPEKTNLADTPEVQDVIALLDVLVSTTHDLSLARALKSPIFGLTDDDLVEIVLAQKKNELDNQSWFNLLQNSEQNNQQMYHLGAKLSLWKAWVDSLPPHDALNAIFYDGDVLARYAAAVHTTQRESTLANLNALLSAALDIDQARYLTPYAFVRAMKAGRSMASADDDTDMTDATQTVKSPNKGDDKAIKLLTIHGAKGLEADVVLILDADAAPEKSKTMSVLVDWPGETFAPTSFVFLASEKQPAPSVANAFDAEKKARQREEVNALYVAMTRARKQLVISSHQPQYAAAQSWWQRVQAVAEPVDAAVFPQAALHVEPIVVATAIDIELLVLPILKNYSNIALNMPLDDVFIANDAIDNIVNLDSNLNSIDTETSLESRIGQAMHRMLQRFDVSDVSAVATEFNLSAEEADQAAQMAKRIVTGEGAWAWDDAVVDWQGNEVELTFKGKLQRLDRLVHRKDTGDWWVLDYKSESQPQNKSELMEQMRGYVFSVQSCYAGEKVRAAFLTAVGKMVEVS